MLSGRLITLEGGEGVGKSTLAAELSDAIERSGVPTVRTREPGGSVGADQIRALLVTGEGDRWSALTESLLIAAARNDHLERTIRPALARGDCVLCDRYTDSTFAYQSAARGLPAGALSTLNDLIAAPVPHLTLVLDLDVKTGLSRARSRIDAEARFEGLDEAFHARVREAFLATAAREPARCVVIDASRPAGEVVAAARKAISERLRVAL